MSKKPNLQSVALAAGVSTATVSQVMRGAGRISEPTRRKVLEAARQVAYLPDARAAALRSGESREIGLLIHKIANPFNAEVMSGINDVMDGEGYLVSVLDSGDDPDREFRHIEMLIKNMRGGIIWVPALNTGVDTLALVERHKVPTVTFLRRSDDRTLDHVSIENRIALADATNHLADLGHRHIAFVGGRKPLPSRQERIDGYRSAMAARGLAFDLVVPCGDTKAAGFEIVHHIKKEHPKVTGLVCNGDMVALGAIAGMQRMGLVPGQDLSIVGFDDIPDAAISTPPLTTMAVQPYELGRKLAKALLDRIQQPSLAASSVLVQATLVQRASTGPVSR